MVVFHMTFQLIGTFRFHIAKLLIYISSQGLSAGLLRQATYTTARLGSFRFVYCVLWYPFLFLGHKSVNRDLLVIAYDSHLNVKSGL